MYDITQRPRRLRLNTNLREMVQDVHVLPSNLVYPLFVKEGKSEKAAIPSMPGIYQYPLKEIVWEAALCWKQGIRAIMLFGVPSKKDKRGSAAYSKNGVVQKAVKAIKDKCPDLLVMTDVCLCSYTDHGHCGVLNHAGQVDNDPSADLIAKIALSHVEAGSDIVAPSDMMDGRIGLTRRVLDQENYDHIPILSYAVKYASHFYGPFRDAAEATPQKGDRKAYQMDFARREDFIREALLDEEEGADILMVKPALAYLDILYQLTEVTSLPLAAYQVSGEYAMIAAAAKQGFIDKKKVVLESLTAIKRAGASLIITYFAKEILKELKY